VILISLGNEGSAFPVVRMTSRFFTAFQSLRV
jgi:hypothetical protein